MKDVFNKVDINYSDYAQCDQTEEVLPVAMGELEKG